MNISQIEDKMIAALEGELSPTDKQLLISKIESDDELTAMWEEYQMLYNDIESVPNDVPGLAIKHNFNKWLEIEAQGIEDIAPVDKVKSFSPWTRWAGIAAIFICVFGFWQLLNQNQQLGNSLANLEAMMEVQSPSERIKAIRVNYNQDPNDVDGEMIKVLINVLAIDKSSNVRLAAVESLAKYIERDDVRTALIKTITTEDDGLVKLEIIHSLGKKQTEEIKSTFEDIVNDDSHEKFVIDRAHMELIRLDTEEF